MTQSNVLYISVLLQAGYLIQGGALDCIVTEIENRGLQEGDILAEKAQKRAQYRLDNVCGRATSTLGKFTQNTQSQ